jgi:hypothetical protein
LAVDDFFGGALVGAGDGLAGGRAVGRGAVVVVGFGALVTGGGVLGRGGLLGRVGPRVGWGERDAVGVGKGVGFGLAVADTFGGSAGSGSAGSGLAVTGATLGSRLARAPRAASSRPRITPMVTDANRISARLRTMRRNIMVRRSRRAGTRRALWGAGKDLGP